MNSSDTAPQNILWQNLIRAISKELIWSLGVFTAQVFGFLVLAFALPPAEFYLVFALLSIACGVVVALMLLFEFFWIIMSGPRKILFPTVRVRLLVVLVLFVLAGASVFSFLLPERQKMYERQHSQQPYQTIVRR